MSELRVGDKVTIRYSKKLEHNGLNMLINKVGVVTKIFMSGGKVTGACVDVYAMRKTRNYHIPINSIEGPDKINKFRTLAILKSTML